MTTPSREPHPGPGRLGRRDLLRLALTGTTGAVLSAALAACGQDRTSPDNRSQERGSSTSTQPSTKHDGAAPKVLVAYFSRPGENYYYGDRTWLEVGNTEVVSAMITELVDRDIHKIQAADPYSDDYDATVARNVREQNDDARPAIANPLPDIDQYDVVLLGSPIWNVRAPMIMSTFTESHDFTGKIVHPFTTHAMSGLSTTERDDAETCPGATISEGFAIQGEEAQDARPELAQWLQRIGLNSRI